MNNAAGKDLLLFPGQGSQYPGIGGDLHEASGAARAIYERAAETLGYDVHALSCGGNEDIHRTRFTQPVLLTHSIACLAALNEALAEHGAPSVEQQAACAGGHSLGEYTALVAADALDFEEALRLVSKRGELMGRHGTGEMSALPLDLESARALADRHFCGIAGCNLAEQTVVGGRAADLAALEHDLQQQYPKKRCARLKTEGAFHTYYMVKAACEFRAVLDEAAFRAPRLQVLSNYNGGFHGTDLAVIKAGLFFQLFHPVLWYDNLQAALAAGVTRALEFGGGIGGGSDNNPDGKRPNLEGIFKKATRRLSPAPAYHAVINLRTLTATAQALCP